MKNKIVPAVIGLVLVITMVAAIQITEFDNLLDTENITFSGDENISRNITIHRGADVTSAFINISGFKIEECYQESANESNQTGVDGDCSLDYGGTYSVDGLWGEGTGGTADKLFDGDFDTYATAEGSYVSINYSKPSGATSAEWNIKGGNFTENQTISEGCFDEFSDVISLRVGSHAQIFGGIEWNSWECYGGSWIEIKRQDFDSDVFERVYEEGIFWQFPDVTSPALYVNGTRVWSLEGSTITSVTANLNELNDSSTERNITFWGNENKTDYVKILKHSNVDEGFINLGTSSLEIFHNYDTPVAGYNIGGTVTRGGIEFNLTSTKIDSVGFWVLYGTATPGNVSVVFRYVGNDSILYEKDFGPVVDVIPDGCCSRTDFEVSDSPVINEPIYILLERTSTDDFIRFYSATQNEPEVFDFMRSVRYLSGSYLQTGYTATNDPPINITFEDGYGDPTNPTLIVNGTTVWTGSSGTSDDMATSINNFLENCSGNSESYCEVPLEFHSDTPGIIELSDINITYNNISKSLNFLQALNDVIDLGACSGGILDGASCIIPFNFHSSTAALLQYSGLDIQYQNKPVVTLESPANNTASPSVKSFNCSMIDEVQISNVTFEFWNSTGDLNLSETIDLTGTYNSTVFEMTFNSTDAFTWNCKATNNESRSSYSTGNFTVNVDIDNPVVSLNYPTNNKYLSSALTSFNYTPEHSTQTVETCQLFINSTGEFLENKSDDSITEDLVNQFQLILPEGIYLWNIRCNTTETGNSAFGVSNFTFTVDTLYPAISISTIATTDGSQTVNTTNTVSDTNLDSCKYSIFNSAGGIDGLNNNVSFTCGTNFQATTTDFGTYNMTIYAVDLASNENSSTLSFTTSASDGGGGSGGGAVVVIGEGVLEATNFSITTRNFRQNMDMSLAKDSVRAREKEFLITNEGADPIEVSIFCSTENSSVSTQIEGNLSICDFVKLSNTEATVSAIEESRFHGSFEVLTPTGASIGDEFFFNIFVIREVEGLKKFSKLSVSARVTTLATLSKWSWIPGQGDKPESEKNSYPVWVASLILSFGLFVLIVVLFRMGGLVLSGFFVGLLMFIASFILLLIWL